MNIFLYQGHTCGYSGSIQAIFPYPDNIICWSGVIPLCEYIAENDMIPSLLAGSYGNLGDRDVLSWGQDYLDCGLQTVWAHYSNGHTWTDRTSMLGAVITVGHGNGVDTVNGDDNPNCGSYGPGLEFYAYKTSESACTPYVAAMMGRLMVDHPAWNFWDARAALRQTAWNYTRGGWVEDGGFGLLDWESALALSLENIEPFAPWMVQVEDDIAGHFLNMTWNNFDQSFFEKTIIVLFETEPARDAVPADGTIIYEGNEESFVYPYIYDFSGWIGFFTKDVAGNFSKLETFDKKEFDVTYVYDPVVGSPWVFASEKRIKGFSSPGRVKGFSSLGAAQRIGS